jgi:broad specificity phosphatase PhoE
MDVGRTMDEPFTLSGEGGFVRPESWNRPKRIILIRHAESEGNVDETVYQRKPDHRIELTEKGKQQARDAGEKLKAILGPNESVYAYVSPYMRTEQTLYEIGQAIGTHRVLGVREEPRMREQDFGNFQDVGMAELKRERQRFGRFFFRFPNGESAADVYDRVTSFRETVRNDMHFGRFNCDVTGCRTEDCTVVIVTHGLTLRVFLMRWYKWSVEMFERCRNARNGELVVMERGKGGRYTMLNEQNGQDEEWLAKFGFNEEMIADQVWAKDAPVDGLNSEWPTSTGQMFFDNFPGRLERTRAACAKWRTPSGVEID